MFEAEQSDAALSYSDYARRDVCQSDETVLGERTRHRAVLAEHVAREWLEGAPKCPLLREHAIAHLGIVDAQPPYGFVRTSMPVTEFLACVAGEGRVFIDGDWTPLRRGEAVLLPIDRPAAYSATSLEPWQLVWVCYEGAVVEKANAPLIGSFSGQALRHTLEALLAECHSEDGGNVSCLHALITTVHRYVLRFANRSIEDERLTALWECVAAKLGRKWTVDLLAREACCSNEHLRRLCQSQIGRSPMQHVTHLRLQHAAELLLHTNHKVEYISALVGYRDAFAFSTAFKKWMRCRPTEYRARMRCKPGGT